MRRLLCQHNALPTELRGQVGSNIIIMNNRWTHDFTYTQDITRWRDDLNIFSSGENKLETS